MSSQSTPDVSVIIVVGSKRQRAANALASVLAQGDIARAEVILIDTELGRMGPLIGSDHPAVRVIQMGYELDIGKMRTYAARVARGRVVAYLEEHSLAHPGWLTGILAAFEREDYCVVGGAMIPADTHPSLMTVLSYINFSAWLAGVPTGEIDLLPGHNSAYRRDLLLAMDDVDATMMVELVVQQKLRAAGHKLYFDSDIRWTHLQENRIDRLCINYFFWNVIFGQQRTAGRSWRYRLLRTMTLPLALLVRTARSWWRLWRAVGAQWPAYFWPSLYIPLIHFAELVGLGIGYWGLWHNAANVLTVGELAMGREPAPRAFAT